MNTCFSNKMSVSKEGAVNSEADDVHVCRGCLALHCKLYDIREKQLDQFFSELTGLPVSGGLLCSFCLHLAFKYQDFKTRCRHSGLILNLMFSINEDTLRAVNRTNLKVPLARSEIWSIDYKPTRELFATNTVHIDILGEKDILDFENEPELEKSSVQTENHSNPKNLLNIHDNIENIGFYDAHDDNVNDTNDTNDLLEVLANVIEVTDHNEDDDIKIHNTESILENKLDDMDNVIKTSINDINSVIETNADDVDSVEENIDDRDDDYIHNDTESNIKIVKSNRNDYIDTKTKVKKDMLASLNCLKALWKSVNNENGDYYQLFERLYKFSQIEGRPKLPGKIFSKKDAKNEEYNFTKLSDLYKVIGDVYNVNIEFVSILEERRAMEEKRKTLAEYSDYCKQCCKTYITANTMERHIMQAHNEAHPFRCEVCFYTFKNEAQFMMHLFKFHCTRKCCRICDQTIVSISKRIHWSEVTTHYEKHKRSAPIICKLCGRKYSAEKHFSKHLRQSHAGAMDAVHCWLCGGAFNGPQGLRTHMVAMHAQAVKCASCYVYFQNKEAMAAHGTTTGECQMDLSACPMCGATFLTESLMKNHYDNSHARYTCQQCNQTFIEYDKYTFHYNKICSNYPKLPEQKSETATIEEDTQRRRPRMEYRRNYPERSSKTFICDVCGKDFHLRSLLRYHMRTHTGEKPHQCEHCHKSFRVTSELQKHVWTHTGKRPFKCHTCAKSFRQQGHLAGHMTVHTNEKKYGCNLCVKRYTSLQSLRNHARAVHEGRPPPRQKNKPPKMDGNNDIVTGINNLCL